VSKYSFYPYDPIYKELFQKEKLSLLPHLKHILLIEHVGSTAIEGLGGKGIIDILIEVKQIHMDALRLELEKLGYIYNLSFSSNERYFFKKSTPDSNGHIRSYHVHLTYPETKIGHELICFRDFLNAHEDLKNEYQKIKITAAEQSANDGKLYRAIKDPIIQKITKQMHEWILKFESKKR
jgi:GrpB-like predicted nucleotidyltransferase (UPF0157 family)